MCTKLSFEYQSGHITICPSSDYHLSVTVVVFQGIDSAFECRDSPSEPFLPSIRSVNSIASVTAAFIKHYNWNRVRSFHLSIDIRMEY